MKEADDSLNSIAQKIVDYDGFDEEINRHIEIMEAETQALKKLLSELNKLNHLSDKNQNITPQNK